MKKILKKNQIIVTALALLIAVAGYINYKDIVTKKNAVKETTGQIVQNKNDDVGFIDPAQEQMDGNDIISNDLDPDYTDITDPGAAVFTGTQNIGVTTSDFIISAKLDREQVRASNKETLLEIINNVNVDEAGKQNAVSAMINMTDIEEREAACELLLEAKGFANVIVTITDEQADVVIYKSDLSDTERVQIEDIVKRKTGVAVENITIFSVDHN